MAKRPGKPKSGKGGGDDAFGQFKGRRKNPKAEKMNDMRKDKLRKKETNQPGVWMDVGPIRLNRYIALAGICSRREADNLIKQGEIKVNGKKTLEMGLKVEPGKDKVVYANRELVIKRFEYMLMNKPKDHLSTMKDDKGRRTVMDLLRKYTKTRLYPVGRLDRNTTGLLLFTNDGELTEKLTQANFRFPKVYHIRLTEEISEEHLEMLATGVKLEDGLVKAEKIGYIEGGYTNEIGMEIISGKDRIVRRMFEHLGYTIQNLDRAKYGALTKKNLPRGTCRRLDQKEVGWLKMLK